MTIVRHIALFLALAIATFAVTLTPSSAQAHDGRTHGAGRAAQHAAHAAPSRIRHDTTATVRAEARIDCAGPCCAAVGHHCSSCCATGLAPVTAPPALPPMVSARSLAREHASLDGIVPEALPEPPRHFA